MWWCHHTALVRDSGLVGGPVVGRQAVENYDHCLKQGFFAKGAGMSIKPGVPSINGKNKVLQQPRSTSTIYCFCYRNEYGIYLRHVLVILPFWLCSCRTSSINPLSFPSQRVSATDIEGDANESCSSHNVHYRYNLTSDEHCCSWSISGKSCPCSKTECRKDTITGSNSRLS